MLQVITSKLHEKNNRAHIEMLFVMVAEEESAMTVRLHGEFVPNGVDQLKNDSQIDTPRRSCAHMRQYVEVQ
jgi:hypothetical protein